MPDLGDGGHVDGVVAAPVAAQPEPVDLPLSGGDLDRGGSVAGGGPVPVTEPARIARPAETAANSQRARAMTPYGSMR
jgi:hypothetical protein